MKPMLLFTLFLLVLSSAAASAVNLTVEYSASDAQPCTKYCVYKNQPSYTIGLGSSTAKTFETSAMSLTSEITGENNDMYIILTDPDTDISNREAFLKERNFDDLINPSFGYPIIDVFSIVVGLNYNNIYLTSTALEQGIGSGIYSLVFRNNGTISSGAGAGSTEVVVEVI